MINSTSYQGLYIAAKRGEAVTHIQVEDTGGNSLPLPVQDYESRGVKPDWRTLPYSDEKHN